MFTYFLKCILDDFSLSFTFSWCTRRCLYLTVHWHWREGANRSFKTSKYISLGLPNISISGFQIYLSRLLQSLERRSVPDYLVIDKLAVDICGKAFLKPRCLKQKLKFFGRSGKMVLLKILIIYWTWISYKYNISSFSWKKCY